MPEDMSLSVNGQSRVPPGFRFHPTEEELLHYYLRKKVAHQKIDLDVIPEIDLNKLEPWDIQERCKIGSTPQSDWYFFSHKDKKYPTGTRTNRATTVGFWKATGRDKVIYSSFRQIGMRKTLVFYKGRAPHGQKSDWIMHEYRLDDTTPDTNASHSVGELTQEDGWVVCRVFKKKHHHKTLGSPNNSSITTDTRIQIPNSISDGALDQILQYMGRSCKNENEASNSNMGYLTLRPTDTTVRNGFHERFRLLPTLDRPTTPLLDPACTEACYQPINVPMTEASLADQVSLSGNTSNCFYHTETGLNNWVALDRFVASHLNGQTETSKQLASFNEPNNMDFGLPPDDHDIQSQLLRTSRSYHDSTNDYNNSEIDQWSFSTRSPMSSSDLFCHVSNASV